MKVLASLATLAFVVFFNFFLFRVIEGDPIGNLFRGRNLSEQQRADLTKQFGLDKPLGGQFVAYVEQTARLNLGRSYTNNQPVWSEIKDSAGPTIALVGISTLLSAVFGILAGIAAAWRRRSRTDYSAHVADDGDVLDARLLARDAPADRVLGLVRPAARGRHRGPELRRHGAREARRRGEAHDPARAHAHASPTSASTRS